MSTPEDEGEEGDGEGVGELAVKAERSIVSPAIVPSGEGSRSGLGDGEGLNLGLGLGVGEGLGVGVGDGEGLGLGEGWAVGEGLGEGLGDGEGVGQDAKVPELETFGVPLENLTQLSCPSINRPIV